MNAYASAAARKYQQINTTSSVPSADPHRLVLMLLDGAISRIAAAKGHMQRHEMANKGEVIGKAMDIIQGLKASLDMEYGGEISSNLNRLYDYILRQLLLGHANNDPVLLDESTNLLGQIREGWSGIEQQVKELGL